VSDVVDRRFDMLPRSVSPRSPCLDGAERPAEWPEVKRRLPRRGHPLRKQHRGVLLLEPW
jgi:hypothetical protein